MYTHSNVYTKKTSSILLLSLLLLSALTFLIPVGVVHATITGTPVLGVANHDDSPPGSVAPTAFTAVTTSVDVIAGTDIVASSPAGHACDGGACAYSPAYFAINFNGVTFSGAQFYLYMSTNGFANVNTTAGDIKFAGPFSASDLTGAGKYQVQGIGGGITGASYWIGSPAAMEDLIVGPIPVLISSAYTYIKVYDGSCGANPTFCGGTGVAGAKQLVIVQPGIVIDVKQGPAWTPVHVSGGGFSANQMVQINASYLFASWSGVQTGVDVATSGAIPTGPGYFGPVLMTIVDTKVAVNQPACCYYSTSGFPVFVTLTAVNATAGPLDEDDVPLNAAQNIASPVVFDEWYRYFNQVSSYFSGAAVDIVPYAVSPGYGNGTIGPATPPPVLPGQPIPVYITGTLGIVGSNFTVSGTTTVWINGVQVGAAVTDSAAGHFIANVTIPKLASGTYEVTVLNNNVPYQFKIKVLPTLILTPPSGTTGSEAGSGTMVTATAYGFPSNSYVSLWWGEYTLGDGNDYFLLNSTVDHTGSYNHTITFLVPPDVYGGAHGVAATTDKWPATVLDTSLDAGTGFVAETTFTVTPSITITPNSVSSNTKGWFVVDGDGFDPTKLYFAQIDNSLALSGYPGLQPGSDGDLNINFSSAGFRPGVHQLELFDWTTSLGSGAYAPQVWTYFNVTITGDFVGNAVAALQSSLTNIQTSLGTINAALGPSGPIQTDLSGIVSTLSGITSTLSGVTSSLSTISTAVGPSGPIQTALSGLASTISSATTGLAKTSDVTSAVNQITASITSATSGLAKSSDVSNAVTTLQGAITSATSGLATGANVNGAVSTLSGDITAAQNAITSGTSTAQTYVLVVAVLAAITLVLELAILVRKLS
jgi:hypothetical protein